MGNTFSCPDNFNPTRRTQNMSTSKPVVWVPHDVMDTYTSPSTNKIDDQNYSEEDVDKCDRCLDKCSSTSKVQYEIKIKTGLNKYSDFNF